MDGWFYLDKYMYVYIYTSTLTFDIPNSRPQYVLKYVRTNP